MSENPLEAKETLDELQHHHVGWKKYLAMTTALIAVAAAIASLVSANFESSALLDKNGAVLAQSKASDQYSFFQAKGIKKSLADFEYQQTQNPQNKTDSERYTREQADIQKSAEAFVKEVENANSRAEVQLHHHHRAALAVTFFQIAIALAAMSALLERKSFWVLSVVLAALGAYYFAVAIL